MRVFSRFAPVLVLCVANWLCVHPVHSAGLSSAVKPASLDDAQWKSLQRAVAVAGSQLVRRVGPTSSAGDDGEAEDYFGFSVAVDGQWAVVGAHLDDVGGNVDQGSAYVFQLGSNGWSFSAKLTADDGVGDDRFGGKVAIQGDLILVSAPRSLVDATSGRGAVYAFELGSGGWVQSAKLMPQVGAAGEYFGSDIALSGSTALIAASGGSQTTSSAYVFVKAGQSWSQQARLTPVDASVGDRFANSVALDGDTALIGAPYQQVGSNVWQGSVYVFSRQGLTWTQQEKLFALDGREGDGFGYSLALDGDRALVGGWIDQFVGTQREGSAYIFVRSETGWAQGQKLTSGETHASESFGASVALHGNRALVGAPSDEASRGKVFAYSASSGVWSRQGVFVDIVSDFGHQFGHDLALDGSTAFVGVPFGTVGVNSQQGSVTVFANEATVWTAREQLTTGNGMAGASYGWSVAIDGDTALVGAPDDDLGSVERTGAVYVLTRRLAEWHLQAQLSPSLQQSNIRFGGTVAVSGGTAAVSALRFNPVASRFEGWVAVFRRVNGAWQLEAELLSPEETANATFGGALAIYGDSLLVGASRARVGVNDTQGAAFVFIRSDATWTLQSRLVADDGESDDQFGSSLAIEGDTAVIGAWLDDVDGRVWQGSAYVFQRLGGVWSQQARLFASDGAAKQHFGLAVALFGHRALVGAPLAEAALNQHSGAAYVFERKGSIWSEEAKLLSNDGAVGDSFGLALDLSDNTALVGAPFAQVGSNKEQGAAYLFSRTDTDWTQTAKTTAPDGEAGQGFGWEVALSVDAALVGTSSADGLAPHGNPRDGSAYSISNLDGVFGSGFEPAALHSPYSEER